MIIVVLCFGRWETPWLTQTCIKLMGVDTGGRETSKCSYISCYIDLLKWKKIIRLHPDNNGLEKKKQFSDGNHPVWGEAVISGSPVGDG